jgi:GT2 family glycosyltransferase
MSLLRRIKTKITLKPQKRNSCNYEKRAENVKLHGACLVFSPDYINQFNGLYPETFMYLEEDILFYISKKMYLKTVYLPTLQILHKEDISTNTIFKKENEKRRFVQKQSIKSLIVFLKLIITYKRSIKKSALSFSPCNPSSIRHP